MASRERKQEDRILFVEPERDSDELEDRGRHWLWIRERKDDGTLLDDGADEWHLLEHLEPALNERSALRIVPEPVDEALHVSTLDALGLVLGLLLLDAIIRDVLEGVVVATVVLEAMAVQVNDVRDDFVQESSLVRHDDQRLGPVREEPFEPDHSVEVETGREE